MNEQNPQHSFNHINQVADDLPEIGVDAVNPTVFDLNKSGDNQGIPNVSDQKTSKAAARGAAVVFVAAAVLFGGFLGYRQYVKAKQASEVATLKADDGSDAKVGKTLVIDNAAPTTTTTVSPNPELETAPQVDPTMQQPMVSSEPPVHVETLAEKKFAASLMDDGGGKTASASADTNQPQTGASPYASDGAGGGKLSDLMKSTTTVGKSAGVLGDRNLTLAKGTFIDCILETRVDTSVPGMTSCVLPRDIYSDNGKVLLLERGSKVTGEYQSGLEQGAKRLFVLWNRVKTPNGVTINLDSPSTDALGGAGMSGKVNNHWGTRFGNALLFSMIEDGFSYLANKGSSASSGGVVYQNSQDSTTKITEEFLKQGANIAPNLVKNQGERIGIYVSRDLYFGSVYELKAK